MTNGEFLTESVAKTLCREAGRSVHRGKCQFCQPSDNCVYWQSFINEANAAIAVIRTIDMHEQARSILKV